MEQKVLSITQINEYIRAQMDRDSLLNSVAVRGEISNYKMYPSGHHYFTLKDEGAALKCVLFKGNALRLRFRPDNGMKVIAMGKISVFPRDGAYQLYCTAMAMDGVGDLHAAFEQLKKKLEAQGLFDPAHKKPLPKYPGTIGIITSSAGAAVHDMLRILKKRYPLSHVRLLPVRVQGVEAPGEIAAAIGYANHFRLADLLIVGRGGGSIEDLWAFNEESVARAVFASEIPVISAVGHETDFTICDFVSDLRAPTPSAAAELALPDAVELLDKINSFYSKTKNSAFSLVQNANLKLNALASRRCYTNPQHIFSPFEFRLDALNERFKSAYILNTKNCDAAFNKLTARLDALSPCKVMERGYSAVYLGDKLVSSADDIKVDATLNIRFAKGRANVKVIDKTTE